MIKAKKFLKCALVLAAALSILVFSYETAESIKNSIEVCVTSMIPSMFAFMVISSYIIDSGLYRYIMRPVHAVLKKLIPLDSGLFSVFILSLIGGYPTGAKLLKEYISENKNFPEIASKMMSFCTCVSPSFALIMLGKGVFGSTDAGAVIYISNILSCVITAVTVSRRIPVIKAAEKKKQKDNILIRSINSASTSLLTVCSVLIAFNVAITVIKCIAARLGVDLPPIFLGTLEISNLLSGGLPLSTLPFVSAISSFGGVCVMFQTAAIIKNSFSLKYYFLWRLPCAAMSAVITAVITNFWEISAEASTNGGYTYLFSANKAIVPVIIVMCVIIFKESEKNFKKTIEI